MRGSTKRGDVMNRVGFRLACGVLAMLVGSAGIARAIDAGTAAGEAAGPAAGSAAGSATTGNADVGPMQPVTKDGGAKRVVKKPGAKKPGAGKTRKAKREARAKKAAEAEKQAAAKKAAAARKAVPAKKPVPKTGAAGKLPEGKARPVGGIQLARIAAPESKLIGTRTMIDCRLQSLLPKAVADRNPEVVLTELPAGKVLALKIVDIDARGGGFLSGRKTITVEGRLTENGKIKGTFTGRQSSIGSVSNCGILERAIFELAGEIASWLGRPAMNSKLGNAQ